MFERARTLNHYLGISRFKGILDGGGGGEHQSRARATVRCAVPLFPPTLPTQQPSVGPTLLQSRRMNEGTRSFSFRSLVRPYYGSFDPSLVW